MVVRWADGQRYRAYNLWLAENVVGLGLDPSTREGILDPSEFPEPTALRRVDLGSDGRLLLRWELPGGPVDAEVHPGWLRSVADGAATPWSLLPTPRPWTAADMAEPPTFSVTDGDATSDPAHDDAALLGFLDSACRHGVARLRGAPPSLDYLPLLARRIGPIRGSNFGPTFTVEARTQPDSTANTGFSLGQHTDLPTRETPPGFQVLHCVENTVAGGWSRLTDGLALVGAMAEEQPEHYEALTTLRWTFMNRAPGEDHRWCGPVIDHVHGPEPLTIRAFYPVRTAPAMDAADVPRAYAALKAFSALAHDPRFRIRYPFEPGDLVIFDNRRVLHGRDEFEPGTGTRQLHGCYLDHDDLYSRLRVLIRNQSSTDQGGTTT